MSNNQEKPLAQKLDERVFEKLLKYNPNTQNLWDIVGIFEHEREKLRLEVKQYLEDIKSSQSTLKSLREQIATEQEKLNFIQKSLEKLPSIKEVEQKSLEKTLAQQKLDTLQAKIAELELENSKLRIELRDTKSEKQLETELEKLNQK